MAKYVNMPKWQMLLVEMMDTGWLSARVQKSMHPTIFYNTVPVLLAARLIKERTNSKDKRIKEYSLTFMGGLFADDLESLKRKIDRWNNARDTNI